MKHILPILFFSFTLFVAQGQKLGIIPKTVEQSVVVDLSDFLTVVELSGKVTNISPNTLFIKWRQNLWDQPFEWQTEISDKDNYYFTNVNGYTENEYVMPLELKPRESFYLSVHVYPNGRAGTATYTFDIVDAKHPDKVIETITYYANIKQPKEEAISDIKKVKIYPNPASSYFEITPNILVYKVKLYNIFGQFITTFNVTDGTKYDISTLPDGQYFLKLLDNNGKQLKTSYLFKQISKA